MCAVRLPQPEDQFFDDDGKPLAGGLVYTYEAGTTTPLATYMSADETVLNENTNPIVLDAAGCAPIWYLDQLYRIVVTDSAGNIIQQADDFGPSSGGGGGGTAGGFGAATTIASATTVDLGTINSHFAVITGTTPITSFGSSASLTAPIYMCRVQSAGLVITYGPSLLNPTGSNITTTQNDYFMCEYLGSGAWKIYQYNRGDASIDLTNIYFTGDLNNNARP